jgi:hypothetical protein
MIAVLEYFYLSFMKSHVFRADLMKGYSLIKSHTLCALTHLMKSHAFRADSFDEQLAHGQSV